MIIILAAEISGQNQDMKLADNESYENFAAQYQMPPKRRFRQRRSGANWTSPNGRVQTPRAKRSRTHTSSLSSLERTPPNVQNQGAPDEQKQSDSHVINVILAELDEMRDQIQVLTNENRRLDVKLTKLDCLSRKSNLKIWGIIEDYNETKYDLKRTVIQLFNEYGININARDIGEVSRIGMKRMKTVRGTLVKFFHSEDKNLVLSRGKQMFIDYKVRLENDFPPEIEERRKALKPVLIAAAKHKNEAGEKKYNAYLSTDRLIINGRQYTVENTQTLPTELKLENISTINKDGITAFFTKNSPLSNHHPSIQQVDGIEYTSNEQYYMHQKAQTFADTTTAEDVLNEEDPKEQKRICRKFDKRDQTAWNRIRVEVMERGLKAKFDQNPELADFLIKTGNTNILECNRSDSFWGIGMALSNPKVWIRNSWVNTAENKLGKLLMDLRTDLKRSRPSSKTD